MVLDNPFFVRDVRALGRKELATLCRWLLFQGVALFLPLWLLHYLETRDDMLGWARSLVLPLFFLVHWISLYLWGMAMGNRIFMLEHQRRTLEALQLISRSPWRWVPEKLLFPFYGLFVIWFAALPFYWIVAVRGTLGVEELTRLAGLMWAPGIIGVAQSLLMSPESWPGAPPLSQRRPAARWLEEGLPARWVHLQLGWYTFFAVLPWALGHRNGIPATPFFRLALTPEHVMAGQVVLVFSAALVTGWSVANPGNPWLPPFARGARVLCMSSLYLLSVGAFWEPFNFWGRAFLILTPLVALWLARPLRRKGPRREDRHSEAEIRRLQAWWDDPVFIRDLRALLRPASLGSSMVRSLVEVFSVPMSLAALTFLLPTGPVQDPLREWLVRTGATCAVLGPLTLGAAGVAFAGRTRRFWEAERQRETLGQLVNSPLSAFEIVRGRWGASALRSLPYWLAALVVCGVGGWWVVQSTNAQAAAYLGLLSLCAVYGLGLGALGSGVAVPRPRAWHFLLVIPVAGGPILLLPYSISAVFISNAYSQDLLPWLILAYLGYPLLVAGCFWAAVRNIDWLRDRDAGRLERE